MQGAFLRLHLHFSFFFFFFFFFLFFWLSTSCVCTRGIEVLASLAANWVTTGDD